MYELFYLLSVDNNLSLQGSCRASQAVERRGESFLLNAIIVQFQQKLHTLNMTFKFMRLTFVKVTGIKIPVNVAVVYSNIFFFDSWETSRQVSSPSVFIIYISSSCGFYICLNVSTMYNEAVYCDRCALTSLETSKTQKMDS